MRAFLTLHTALCFLVLRLVEASKNNMRLVASTTLPAAMAASQALRIGSTSAMASIINVAYDDEVKKRTSESYLTDEECSFVASFNLHGVGVATDTGILCSDHEQVCVEDATSSLGGRCASVTSDASRKLKGTTCTTKCTPASACEGLTQTFISTKIGDGSCCGEKACVGLSGGCFDILFDTDFYRHLIASLLADSTVGPKSCVGYKNCYYATNVTIGSKSCNGDSIKGSGGLYGYVCAYAKGEV
jgi:hypothetical protein